MLIVAALALGLQAKPQFSLKPVWAAGPMVQADDVKVAFNLYGYWTSPTTFRYLAKQVNAETSSRLACICEFDTEKNNFHVVSTSIDYEGAPPDWSKYVPRGRYVEGLDESSQTETYVDLLDLQPKFQTVKGKNGFETLVNQDDAGKAILCQGNYEVDGLGDFYLLYDSPNGRFLYANQGVFTCGSRSWNREDDLVAPGKLAPPPGSEAKPVFIGDPDNGPFEIQNDRANPTSCFYFDADWNSMKVDTSTPCYDAGSAGFLVKGQSGGRSTLECLDPKTGAVLWTRNDLADFVLTPRWSEGRVMLATTSSGGKTFALHLLDPATGQTLGDIEAPAGVVSDFQARGDTVIFHDEKGRFYGYRVVQS